MSDTYSLSQVLRRAALVNRNGIASRFQGHRTSWQQTLERVQKIAAVLLELGLAPGDRVAILAGNGETYFQLIFAIPWAGGVAVPLNTRLGPEEMLHCVNDSGSRFLLVDDAFADMAAKLPAGTHTIEQVLHMGGATPPGEHSLEALVRDASPVADAGCGGSDLFALYYTGGTTGRSKGVMLTHDGAVINSLQWALEVGVGRDDLLLIVAPMFHLVGGLNSIAAGVLAAGVCMMPRFEVDTLLKLVVSERVTKIALVPTMMTAILAHPDIATYDLSSLRRISYGGSPITETLLRQTLEIMPHVQLYQVYGQTEGGPTISILKPEYHLPGPHGEGKLRSAGQPIAGTEVAILDETDAPLPAGQVGEIGIRGLTVSPGYWNLPEQTAEACRSGWLHTGDAGYFDGDGFLYIVDRIKDMIITGGENVYSQEVENVLGAHPAVAECAVFGVPDEQWGERVHAVVRLRIGASAAADELMTHCRKTLAAYKCVRSIDFRTEPFPLSGANKILKRELRAPFWQERARQV